jgi:hypothetical protein
MYYIVYKISNTINNKIYVGYHSTVNINDDYLGSGKHILNAIKKYGSHNFKKEILYVFPNKEEALLKEAEIVNKEFVNRKDTYNLKLGGEGGWEYINNLIKNDDSFREKIYLKMGETLKQMYALNILNKSGENNPMYGKSPWNKGISLSIETRNKISQNNGNKLSDELIKNRLIDLEFSELKRGYISQLAKKWMVSHTQVKRFINKFGNIE